MSATGGAMIRRFTLTVSGSNILVTDSGSPVNPLSTTALAAATSQTLALFTLPAGCMILAVKCKPTTAFTGGAVTMTTVEVGRALQTDCYFTRFNIFTAAADTAVRRARQLGSKLFTAASALPDTSAATPAVPVACVALGLEVGDKVKSISAVYGPFGGFTEAGSTGANIPTATAPGGLDLANFESVISVAGQIQAIGSSGDLTPFTGSITVEKGGGLESDAAAGTVINAIIRTTAANLAALTAGGMEIDILMVDAPTLAIGIG